MTNTFLLDERIKVLITLIPDSALEQDAEASNNTVEMQGKITFVDIDRLSKKHFPLCMQEVIAYF
jgi:DNA primase large subunit